MYNNYFRKIPDIEFSQFLIDAKKYVSYNYIAQKLHVSKAIISMYVAAVYDSDDNQLRLYAKYASPERQEEIIEIIVDELERQVIDRVLSNENLYDFEQLIAKCYDYLMPKKLLKDAVDEEEATDIIFDMNDFENSRSFPFISRSTEDWNEIKDKNITDIIWFDTYFDLIFDTFRCDVELIQNECYKTIYPDYSVALDKVLLDSDACIKSFKCLDLSIYQKELEKESKDEDRFDEEEVERLKRSIIRKAATYYSFRSRPYNDAFDAYASYIIENTPESLAYPIYHDWSFVDFFDEIISLEPGKWFDYAKFRLFLDTILY